MDVHLRDLRYFLAVADELHFTRAAQRLFVSQPALSRQIRALEQHLRGPLFERRAQGVRLTVAGRAFLPYARQVVAAWDETQAAVAEAIAASNRRLVVGLSISVGRGLLPTAMASFAVRHPDVTVDLHQVPFDDPTMGLADGAVDVAFCWLPLPGTVALEHHVLFTEERALALPVAHPLTARAELSIEDLLDEPFLALPESAGPLRSFWLGEDARQGRRPVRVATEVHGPEEVVEALGRGVGVAFISTGNAEIYQRPEFVVRPVPGLAPAQLAVAWRAHDARPVVQDFVRSCLEAVSDRTGGRGVA